MLETSTTSNCVQVARDYNRVDVAADDEASGLVMDFVPGILLTRLLTRTVFDCSLLAALILQCSYHARLL